MRNSATLAIRPRQVLLPRVLFLTGFVLATLLAWPVALGGDSGTSGVGETGDGRTETQDYVVGVSTPNCSFSSGGSAVRCFEVKAGETAVYVEVMESSPTKDLGQGIAVRACFPGADYPAHDFCGHAWVFIPPGATVMEVEVYRNLMNGFCDPFVAQDELSPAVYGAIRATFIRS